MRAMTLTSSVLMVRPAAFGFSEEAAASNVFQQRPDLGPASVATLAVQEFDRVVVQLRGAGITVRVVEDGEEPQKPDAVFPNNWVSWMPDGAAVVYPMAVPSRRAERRGDILPAMVSDHSALEVTGAFVEGTGSLVFDHANRVAYACRSPRTVESGVRIVCGSIGYDTVLFDASLDAAPVYHTNVVLALGPDWAVWFGAGAAVGRAAVEHALQRSGRTLIQIDERQVRAYCGNVLVLRGSSGPVTVMSRTASTALSAGQRDRMGPAVIVDIPTIEQVGGGSARCMLAEVFEPS